MGLLSGNFRGVSDATLTTTANALRGKSTGKTAHHPHIRPSREALLKAIARYDAAATGAVDQLNRLREKRQEVNRHEAAEQRSYADVGAPYPAANVEAHSDRRRDLDVQIAAVDEDAKANRRLMHAAQRQLAEIDGWCDQNDRLDGGEVITVTPTLSRDDAPTASLDKRARLVGETDLVRDAWIPPDEAFAHLMADHTRRAAHDLFIDWLPEGAMRRARPDPRRIRPEIRVAGESSDEPDFYGLFAAIAPAGYIEGRLRELVDRHYEACPLFLSDAERAAKLAELAEQRLELEYKIAGAVYTLQAAGQDIPLPADMDIRAVLLVRGRPFRLPD